MFFLLWKKTKIQVLFFNIFFFHLRIQLIFSHLLELTLVLLGPYMSGFKKLKILSAIPALND